MENVISDLSFVLCPGNMPEASYLELYKEIYECWSTVWSEAFNELGVKKRLLSDAFTRQDLIGATFFKKKCIGMFFMRWTDATRIDFAADSYFQIWGEEHLKTLCSRGEKIIVSSNLTVHPMARGEKLGFSGKDLIIGMTVQTFLQSKAHAMTGAMRVDRGANKATARWGSTTIASRVPCEYGEDNTELVGFFRDDIAKSPRHELADLTELLWEKRLIIPRINIDSEFAADHFLHVPKRVA